MIIKPIDAESVQSFKAVRLAALRDTPLAFGSTFAEESQLSDADWARRVARRNGDRSIGFLAWDGDQPAGLAASYFDQDDPGKAYLVSMWVAPSHRRRGVGQLLVEGVIAWACDRHARTLSLMVTSNNEMATLFVSVHELICF
jgi:GNAT superfamily N-acetyltransferase